MTMPIFSGIENLYVEPPLFVFFIFSVSYFVSYFASNRAFFIQFLLILFYMLKIEKPRFTGLSGIFAVILAFSKNTDGGT